ncbi:MAG: polyprenyl synthetase family protein [Christensenellaceae bacterium]|nr:polyprenyl synthetase family protein [Christensenellaceae bacterium]
MMNYSERSAEYRNVINEALADALVLKGTPKLLRDAMKYSVDAGGKRIRPCLTMGVCDMVNGNRRMAIKLACGIEMIHTYSLIHDDLPCMDDDDMRRGRPSNHKVFGEGQAVLAGDGLLTYAFEWMLEAGLNFNDPNYYRAVAEIAKRAGVSGMIAGQSADLMSENEGIKNEAELNYIHTRKTADMLIASVLAGAYCGNPTEEQLICLENYAQKIGLLFQIKDDILDAEGDFAVVGKTLGKDSAHNKLTFVSLYGLEKAKVLAESVAREAERKLLDAFGDKCQYLYDTIYYILNRSN